MSCPALAASAGETSRIAAAMLLIGLGIGLAMQVMVMVAQNSVDRADLGAATSSVTFLRQLGASGGVAVIGALLSVRFAERVPGHLADVLDSLTPDAIAALPAAARVAFGEAAAPVFALMALPLVVAFLLALALPARPLRTTAHVDQEVRA